MKALTIRQPWAWAVMAGGKTVENRTRGTKHRGTLAVHAGREWSTRGGQDPRVYSAIALFTRAFEHTAGIIDPALHHDRIAFGALLGTVELVDSHPDTGCCRPWGESAYEEAGGKTRTVLHHLVLEDPRPLAEPVPCRGALGLWTVPEDLLHDCGHLVVQPGCGGCDPGAIAAVLDEHGRVIWHEDSGEPPPPDVRP